MKRILIICFMLFFVFIFCGCDSTTNRLKKQKCAQLYKVLGEFNYKEYSLNDWELMSYYIYDADFKIRECNEKNQINKIYDETISKIYEIEKFNGEFINIDFREVIFNGNAIDGEYQQIHIIDNYDELIELFSNMDLFYHDEKNFVIDNFTSEFFNDKKVLVYFYHGESADNKRYIKEVSKCDNYIKMQLICESDGTFNTDVFVKPLVIELDKNDISQDCIVELFEKGISVKK